MKKRLLSVVLTLFLLFPLTIVSFASSPPAVSGANDTEWEILERTNQERIAQGHEPLSAFPAIQGVARTRASEIVQLFSHTRPDKRDWATVWGEFGLSYGYIGENIAYGYVDATDVMQGWMNSTGHRQNILSDNFSHVGVGYVVREDTPYQRYYSQDFLGGCSTKQIVVLNAAQPIHAKLGTTIDQMALVLEVKCTCGVTSYLPLPGAICSGYSMNTYGEQTVTVNLRHCTTTFKIFLGFTDIAEKDWFYNDVQTAVDAGLFHGTSPSTFAPNDGMSRSMLVTVLYRLQGEPPLSGGNQMPFVDVNADQYYTNAVQWAYQNRIVNGMDPTHFMPDRIISRQEIAAILYRYAQYQGKDTNEEKDLSHYTDENLILPYARAAMKWANAMGLIKGITPTQLSPGDTATRAQVAVILNRYCTI